ncbi:membrane protein insertion efficiency factor YidD [Pedobacter sp. Hv1]|uniref:membrane protein insertion efficiency factor YidD n=1 Tax=Pedobacter sp. Hv1 TaxID=1740090 RepID=UPI0006D89ED4|nr:hypothetical protein AQF98_15690 [Pedobacter sp. Hv1]
MKILLLLIIKLYWLTVPKNKRRKCIFKISCSQHVYHTTKKEGLFKGLSALKYRFRNCRAGYYIFEHPITKSKIMALPNAQIITEAEISERFIK